MEIKRFGYYWLNNWGLANMIQLATQDFCARYLNHSDAHSGRQYDQMTQVARSASANIAEGGSRHSTSKETETKLTDVARATLRNIISFAAVALTAALLTGCADNSASDILDPSADNTEIKVNADVWQVMEGTRATTYNSAADLQREGFNCTLYKENTTTTYDDVENTNVNWSSSAWAFFDRTHKWPDDNGALDFFAVSPQTVPSYITELSYTIESSLPAPSFSCTIPENQTGLKEFVWALTPRRSRQNSASGVMMHFVHPFARIRFVLSPASGSNIEVTSVKITGNFKLGGTCTLSADGTTSTWSSLSGSGTEIGGEINNDYIVIPQTVGSHNVVVTAKWSEWSKDVTKDYNVAVSVPQWDAGKSYTYTLTLSEYALIVDTEKFTEQW